jgi:hypothetical protein
VANGDLLRLLRGTSRDDITNTVTLTVLHVRHLNDLSESGTTQCGVQQGKKSEKVSQS